MYFSQQAHHKAHPVPRVILGRIEHCTISSLDLRMHPGGWSLGRQEARDRRVFYKGPGPENHHFPSQHNVAYFAVLTLLESYRSFQISSSQGSQSPLYATFRSRLGRRFFYAASWALDCGESTRLHTTYFPPVALAYLICRTAA